MKHILMLMHGEYDNEGFMGYKGRNQMMNLAQSISHVVPEKVPITLLTANDRKMMSSANELRLWLNVAYYHQDSRLKYKPNQSRMIEEDFENIDAVIADKKYMFLDCLAIMTHSPVAKEYSEYFMKKNCGKNIQLPEIYKGQGAYINIDKKECVKIPRF